MLVATFIVSSLFSYARNPFHEYIEIFCVNMSPRFGSLFQFVFSIWLYCAPNFSRLHKASANWLTTFSQTNNNNNKRTKTRKSKLQTQAGFKRNESEKKVLWMGSGSGQIHCTQKKLNNSSGSLCWSEGGSFNV